jgi:2-methylisocitrate lyase-like PEP mutase family enzyme
MRVAQREKGERFRRLHEGPCFVIPNPWDVGSAKVLAGMGFAALATSSAASAAGKGKHDGELTREEALGHARTIVGATELPVSADLENGFGDAPAAVAQTVRLAGEAGLVGCTIEDTKGEDRSGGTAKPLYDFELAVERVAAGVKAARALGFPFLLTARTHNLLFAGGQLEETRRRLQAFEKAGADVLFAPGLPDLATVRAVCGALTKPFNFMVGIPGKSFSVSELAAAGVRRISLATSLYRAAMTGFLDAAREVQDRGTFTFLDRSVKNTGEVVDLMGSSR